MPRATNAPASRRRRKRILQEASGFRGRRSKLYRYAKDAVYKARQWAYRDRKNRKRNFRMLWIMRINNACRLQGLTYSRFMEGLRSAGIEVNRKMMAELAVAEDGAFKALFDASSAALKDKPTATLKAA